MVHRLSSAALSIFFLTASLSSAPARADWGPWVNVGVRNVYWRATCLSDSGNQGTWQWNVEVRSEIPATVEISFTITDYHGSSQSGTWVLNANQTIPWGYRFHRSCDGGDLGLRIDDMQFK